jgi:hypothetical protein
MLVLCGLPSAAMSATINFPDFSSVSLLTLNGSASQAGSVLRLTPDLQSQAGSAFLSSAVNLGGSGSFSTAFSYRIAGVYGGGPLGSDGFAFLIQADPRGATALGTGGGDHGYGGATPITPSLAVEFDTHPNFFDPGDDEIALHANGNAAAVPLAYGFPGYTLNNGTAQFAWIDYLGATKQLSVFAAATAVKPGSPLFTATVDIPSTVGSSVHFGFTAGTGGGSNTHDVLSWELAPVPAPPALALVLTGLASGWLVRRRRAGRR